MDLSVSQVIRLAKPRVVALLDLAAVAGYFAGRPDGLLNLALVLIGGSLASAGAMMVNEAYEVDRDVKMTRTSWRPTARGELSPKNVAALGSVLVAVGVIVSYFVNLLTAFFVLFGALYYIFVYTMLLKPRHWLNIVIGGLAGSAAAWAGYSASTGYIDPLGLMLGLLIFMWTPGHFWSLALRYKEDYRNAGFPMLPVLVDEKTSAKAIAISNILMAPIALSLAIWLGMGYLIVSAVATAILFYFNIRLLRNPTAEEAWISFKVSSPYLAILLITIIISRAL